MACRSTLPSTSTHSAVCAVMQCPKCWHCTLHCVGTKQLPTLTMSGHTRPRNGAGPAWPALAVSHMIALCRHKGTTVLWHTSTCPTAQACGENCKTRGSAKPPLVSGFAYSSLRIGSERTAKECPGRGCRLLEKQVSSSVLAAAVNHTEPQAKRVTRIGKKYHSLSVWSSSRPCICPSTCTPP